MWTPVRLTILLQNKKTHPASRASSCLFLYGGGEKEALPESCQLFEAAAARTSGLVNLVFSRQTGFFQCEHPFSDKTDGYNLARCTMTNQDGFEICSACSKPNTNYSRQDCSYGQFMSRVTGIFEIDMSVLNIANEVSKFP